MTTIIGTNRLIEILREIRGARFGSILTATDPRRSGMRMYAIDGSGDPNPWIEGTGQNAVCFLRKIRRTAVCLNENYENGVRRQMEREGLDPDSWEPGDTWYVRERREDGTLLPFGIHPETQARYLCARSLRYLGEAAYRDTRTNEVIDPEEVSRFMPVIEHYAKQRRHGIENVIRRQVWDINGIRGINIGGERYEIHPSYAHLDAVPVMMAIAEMVRDHELAREAAQNEDIVPA